MLEYSARMTTSPGSSSSIVISTNRLTTFPPSSKVRYAVNLSMGNHCWTAAPLRQKCTAQRALHRLTTRSRDSKGRQARGHHVLMCLHLGEAAPRARKLENHRLETAVDIVLADSQQLFDRRDCRQDQLDPALVEDIDQQREASQLVGIRPVEARDVGENH